MWTSVTLAVLIALSGACGSSTSYTAAKNERSAPAKAAAAAKAKLVQEKRRLARAQQQAAAQRRAAIAARKAAIAKRLEENRRRTQAGSTTTTTPTIPPTSGAPAPTTTPTTADPAPAANAGTDLTAVQATLDRLNRAFRVGVADGIAASETANYWVTSGVYSGNQCAAFEAKQGGGVVRESLSIHPGTFRADPRWIDPRAGVRPVGRVYSMVVDDLQTLVPSGEQRQRSAPLHASVRPDGRALLFLRCS